MNKTSQLEQLKKFTRVAADTADFETMRSIQRARGYDQSKPDPRGGAKARLRRSLGSGCQSI